MYYGTEHSWGPEIFYFLALQNFRPPYCMFNCSLLYSFFYIIRQSPPLCFALFKSIAWRKHLHCSLPEFNAPHAKVGWLRKIVITFVVFSQLITKLQKWSLCKVKEDILPFVLNTWLPLGEIWVLNYSVTSIGQFSIQQPCTRRQSICWCWTELCLNPNVSSHTIPPDQTGRNSSFYPKIVQNTFGVVQSI